MWIKSYLFFYFCRLFIENLMNPRAFSGICDVNYVKVGCYKEKKNNVALPQELFQDRFANQPNYSGQNVDWADYSNYLKR